MENELNNNFENEFNDDITNLKFLEDFFSKEINNTLTPQEMIIISISLNHVAGVLSLYNRYSNIAVFDVKEFRTEHPEYTDIDFQNLQNVDPDTIEEIGNILHGGHDGTEGEEFSKGDILIKNIIDTLLNTSLKFYEGYTKEYSKKSPEDTEQFFTILDNCLQNSLSILKVFFTQRFRDEE
jgi:hypothetical protein